jgi:murein DD-endopeptidase MepM/ murein hydrolase activator NlpD
VVGYVGSSGDAQATLPHLHVGHYVGGVAVDPLQDLRAATRAPLPVARRSAVAIALAILATGVLAAGAIYTFER